MYGINVHTFPDCAVVKKNHLKMQGTQEMCISSLGWDYPLRKEMVTYSSILAWKSPWTKESG